MGRTANLASIGTLDPVEGVPEVICPNRGLKKATQEVLFGYLGPVTDPRSDAYMEGQSPSGRDSEFLTACAGPWGRDEIFDLILGK